ncbi:MAG: Crp/Fnr family transcriptional regulator [Thermomicrobiales bacterium]
MTRKDVFREGSSVNPESSDDRQIRQMMRSVPYLTDLDEPMLDILIQSVQVRRLPARRTIFVLGEGQGEAPFYLILEGTVRVFLSSLSGREQVLRLFHAGDTFGEVPLFDGGPYPASADTMTDVTLAVIARDRLLQYMKEYPELSVGIVKVMASRLRHFNALIEDLSLRRVIGRVAHLLAAENPADLTQAQMASMIGASREMVNRSLHTLEDDGIIQLAEDGAIVIRDPQRLREVVDQG